MPPIPPLTTAATELLTAARRTTQEKLEFLAKTFLRDHCNLTFGDTLPLSTVQDRISRLMTMCVEIHPAFCAWGGRRSTERLMC